MITDIRISAQQLTNPRFDNPKDLVAWMGAIQAQDYNMLKWAVGVRLKSGTIDKVEKALDAGEILRTHVMRPTWHLVVAEDIRWMLKLSAKRIQSAWASWDKQRKISPELLSKSYRQMEKALEGNKSLTKQEIGEEFNKAGFDTDDYLLGRFLMSAEIDGLICSGVEKNRKPTYALLEERVASAKELHKDEALAKLALNYFRSHSPATLQDFVWWSGLLISEARHAIGLIENQLIKDRFDSSDFLIHSSCSTKIKSYSVFHLMPAYDEYLISYKDRSAAMDLAHYPKAFNNFGTFYPVVMFNGRIVGNWRKSVKKGEVMVESSFFDRRQKPDDALINTAKDRYKIFIGC